MLPNSVLKQCNVIRKELGKSELPIKTVGDQTVLWDVNYVNDGFGLDCEVFIDGAKCDLCAWVDPRNRNVAVYKKVEGSGHFEKEQFEAVQVKIIKDGEVVLGFGLTD